jgi:hypothetical protein
MKLLPFSSFLLSIIAYSSAAAVRDATDTDTQVHADAAKNLRGRGLDDISGNNGLAFLFNKEFVKTASCKKGPDGPEYKIQNCVGEDGDGESDESSEGGQNPPSVCIYKYLTVNDDGSCFVYEKEFGEGGYLFFGSFRATTSLSATSFKAVFNNGDQIDRKCSATVTFEKKEYDCPRGSDKDESCTDDYWFQSVDEPEDFPADCAFEMTVYLNEDSD